METIEQVTVTVTVRINPNPGAAEDAQDLARGIVEQALELGRNDMDRQAEADGDPDDRIGTIASWTFRAPRTTPIGLADIHHVAMLAAAARGVVANWDHGDLAAAVRDLATALREGGF